MSETKRYARDKALQADLAELDRIASRVLDAIEDRPRLRAAELLWGPLQELGAALNEARQSKADRTASDRARSAIPRWPDVLSTTPEPSP